MDRQQESMFAFRKISLFKEQILGRGSYGQVCIAKCDNLTCAAKILHTSLCSEVQHKIAHDKTLIAPIRKYEQEIEVLSAIKHPNIVQYLGIHLDEVSGVPALLMELMDHSLTHFLDSSSVQVPFHIQVNICHDITLALAFLHSNNIIHRDLSSNNVLLIGNVRAKLTDFGMAKLMDSESAAPFTLTKNPGSDAYMPPEAMKSPITYTEKLDCFSFGVLAIQILTRKSPNPGDLHKEITTESDQSRKLFERIPEVTRRENHIREVDSKHPLLSIALSCLNDQDIERPSAARLSELVEGLKSDSAYSHSIKQAKELMLGEQQRAEVFDNQETAEAKSTTVELTLENLHLKQQLEKVEDKAREYDQKIITKEGELTLLKRQYEASEQARLELERRLQELKLQTQHPEGPVKLIWSQGCKAPREICKGCDPVVHDNLVYFKPAANVEIYAYDITNHEWLQLPNCVNKCCSLAIVKNQLTTVGGYQCHDNYSNELFSLAGKGLYNGRTQSGKSPWNNTIFPPMKTRRCNTTSLCTEQFLVVAGGVTMDRKVLKTVEVMNLDILEWSVASELPIPLYSASMVASEERLYIVGGSDKDGDQVQTIFKCSMTTLLHQHRKKTKMGLKKGWKKGKVADIPVTDTTCVLANGQLLTIGGMNWDGRTTTAIHMYSPSKRKWVVISHMSLPRSDCFVAFLQAKNELIVVGGYTDKSFAVCNLTDEVELAIAVV